MTSSYRSPKSKTDQPMRGYGRTVLVMLFAAMAFAACGRPEVAGPTADANEISIAGVSVTSPDAVVTVLPTASSSTSTEITRPQPTQKLYTIQDGDTISKIAGDHGIPVAVLVQANGITDVHSIRPGEELVIPIPPPVDVTVSSETTTPASASTTP